MSGMALIWAANVKGLKPAAKIVLIQLADFHNKETGQCNPSAQRLADECEMGRATLFRHMTTLEECGLVTRHARGDGDGGRGSNQYELHLDISLGPSARPKGGGSDPNGVESQNETGGNVSKMREKSLKGETGVVSNRDRNLTIEPKKEPPSRRREAVEAEKILAAYPPDRLRGKAVCIAQIEEAMKEEIESEDLLLAVQAYATDSAGFTRSKVCFSDNWFQSRRWLAFVERQAEDREKATALQVDHHKRLACWISDRSPMCKHITAPQVTALLASKLVTTAQIQAAGLRT
ncbi:helix-turn-helix domain-containing protein [Octadecabacter sp. G9-8]|uniref:Helix-turn-helix domain-containing protein n=1 Tax=Octadecabacter dasysiphoniae TaxID=2909341 RepID=A0ABS9CRP0_9RHOB|nr:helix-turn-helix domain-containing protein [Octadecabacter dasysiphoniae]MCF2869903.1 helix-turn-helix domain-containing protein [Octadecabacter dasysiphoniae]